MKKTGYILLVAMVAATGWGMAPLKQKAAVSLKVKRVSSQNQVDKFFDGQYVKDYNFKRSIGLEVNIRNMRSTGDATVRVEYVFLARPARGGKVYVHDLQVESVTLSGRVPYRSLRLSRAVESNVFKMATSDPHRPIKVKSGSKAAGYIVRVMEGERIVKVYASSSTLKRIGSSEKQFAKLIGAE